ncbi:hypothetical protein ACOYR1_04030 [Thalassotalea piscium]
MRSTLTGDFASPLFIKAIFIALSFILWIDAFTGMIQFYAGVDLKLSLIYKLPLIGALIVVIGLYSRLTFSLILLSIFILILGPLYRFSFDPKIGFLANDLSLAIKLITPFIAFYFCRIVATQFPNIIGSYGIKALWINFYAVVFNLIIGALGYGYPSYSGGENGEGIGVNGFYIAGNELSGCFVLLFAFVMHSLWNSKRFFYYPMSVFTLICGALIATKTAIFASLLLVFAIPIFNERENIFKLTKLKVKLFLPLFVIVALAVYFIIDFLMVVGLYDKVIWVIEEKGIWGLILSGRVEFSNQVLEVFFWSSGWFEYLFGIGTIGMSDYFNTKYSAEVDPVDIFVYFGVLGSVIVYMYTIIMMLPSLRLLNKNKYLPPIIVLVNILLLLLSVFSGHILNSGMLGLLWGMFNGLVYVKIVESK